MLSDFNYLLLNRFSIKKIDLNAPQLIYQNRYDNKFILSKNTLNDFLLKLDNSWSLSEIDGRTSQTYINWHFDTKNLNFYHDHIKLKRKRAKVRIRKYPSQNCMLELKLKGKRGQTLKHRWTYEWEGDAVPILTDKHVTALNNSLQNEYQWNFFDNFINTATSKYLRTSLVSNTSSDRITIDEHFATLINPNWKHLLNEFVILEIKSEKIKSSVSSKLYDLGSRPRSFSKYLLSVSHKNDLRLLYPWNSFSNDTK
jgi:hypothetical protein